MYFEDALQHKVFDRNDGPKIQTKAYFNNLVSYDIDAFIDATCDGGNKGGSER